MSKKYEVGQRVRITALTAHAYRHFSVGMTGTVTGYGDSLCVEFDNWTHGHSGETDVGEGQWYIDKSEGITLAKVRKPRPRKAGGRCDQVLGFLLAGKSLTQGEAIVLGFGTRLAATVHTLKGRGHTIITTMKEDSFGHPYAEYSLVKRSASGKRK
ncbi:helix-turn-helix domain-containing protein [Labrys neptuniae]